MSDDIEIKIRKEFIAEASEMLETVESAFIELERNPDDVRVIDKIFRLAHTIKGSALSVGFTRLGEFAHVVETLLVRVREKKLVMTPEISDLLLRSNDRLAQFVNALGKDPEAVVETREIEAMINEVLSRKAAGEVSAAKVEAATALPAFGFFDDEPTPKAVVIPAPSPVAPVPHLAKDALVRAYVGIARLAAVSREGRAAFDPVLADLEKTLEEVA